MKRPIRATIVVLVAVLAALLCVGYAITRGAAPPTPASAFNDTEDLRAVGAGSPPTAAAAGAAAAADNPKFSERWRASFPVEVVGLPAVDELGVVVTAGESEVIALSPSGAVQWTAAVDGALVRAPRLVGDRVFVAAKRAVVALDRASGTVVWSVPTTADGDEDNRANEPVVVGDVVIVTTDLGDGFGLDRATGAPRWSVTLPTASTAEPAAGGGVVVAVGIGQWWALDPATGATVWSGDIGTYGTSSPAVFTNGGRTLAALATDGRVLAVDAHTGDAVWQSDAEQSEFFQVPVVSPDGELLVPDHWGRLAAFDVHDGHLRWRVEGPDGVAEFGQPALLGPRLVALALDGDGPRVASPSGSQAIKPPADGHGVAVSPAGQLVVTTWGGDTNYVVAYDVDVGPLGQNR